ncbi:MAG: response regulator transcription factor [Terrimicrobiaceae bacterium]
MTAHSKEKGKKSRILLVDDHPATRLGLSLLIGGEPDLAVCGEAESAGGGLDAALAVLPDLVLSDISLPGKSGLEMIKDIHAALPSLPVLVLSMHDEKSYAERALQAGSRGYIMKNASGEIILQAIRSVLAGNVYVSGVISAGILERISRHDPAEKTGIDALSHREFEIFQLIGSGLSTQDIAKRLNLSSKTVDSHKARIKNKVHKSNPSELVAYAANWVALQTC